MFVKKHLAILVVIIFLMTLFPVASLAQSNDASFVRCNKVFADVDGSDSVEFTVFLRESDGVYSSSSRVYVASNRGYEDRIVPNDQTREVYNPNRNIKVFEADSQGIVAFNVYSSSRGESKIAVGLNDKVDDYLYNSSVTKEEARIIDTKTINFGRINSNFLSFDSAKGRSGEIVRIPIKVNDASGLTGGKFRISNLDNVAELINIEKGNMLERFLFEDNVSEKLISFANSTGIYGDGDLCILTFKLKGHQGESTEINLSELELNDEWGNPLPARVIQIGKIEIFSLYGDVNNDEQITAADATLILQAVENRIILSNSQRQIADVDGDGIISRMDAELILKYVVHSIDRFPVEK